MRKEVEEWKMAFEDQSKKVEDEKSWLRELHTTYVRFKATLEARERDMEKDKEKDKLQSRA